MRYVWDHLSQHRCDYGLTLSSKKTIYVAPVPKVLAGPSIFSTSFAAARQPRVTAPSFSRFLAALPAIARATVAGVPIRFVAD